MIEAIRRLSEALPLADNYKWDLPEETPIEIPPHIEGSFDQNIYLKNNLKQLLRQDNSLDTHYWLIHEWGGIRSFRAGAKNNGRIRSFIERLPSGRLTRDLFDRISSLSKVAAYLHPETYSIYDSRAIYTLNWLMFTHTEDRLLFPQPTGRNAVVGNIHMRTLFELSGLEYSVRDHQTAYRDYCKLIKRLSVDALGHDMPYYLEMLLFVAAVEWVPAQIKRYAQLSIDVQASGNNRRRLIA